jgi:hypothetical protein
MHALDRIALARVHRKLERLRARAREIDVAPTSAP